MVLAQLGGSISRAIQQMSNATIIDEKALNDCLNEITRALLQSDVQFKLVRDMQTNIKKIVNLDDLAAGHNKRRIIQQVIIFYFIIFQKINTILLNFKFNEFNIFRRYLTSSARFWTQGSPHLPQRRGKLVLLCL
jgi:signal recognition particle GTPase